MKNLLLTLIISIIAISSYGQTKETELYKRELPVDSKTGLIAFTEVVEVKNISKNALYLRAREWFIDTYKSSKDVLQMDDKESGVLIGNAINTIYISSLGAKVKMELYYSIKISVKEGRYKYIITDMKYGRHGGAARKMIIDYLYKKNGKLVKTSKSYKEETITSMDGLILRLKKAMDSTSAADVSDDDW